MIPSKTPIANKIRTAVMTAISSNAAGTIFSKKAESTGMRDLFVLRVP